MVIFLLFGSILRLPVCVCVSVAVFGPFGKITLDHYVNGVYIDIRSCVLLPTAVIVQCSLSPAPGTTGVRGGFRDGQKKTRHVTYGNFKAGYITLY